MQKNLLLQAGLVFRAVLLNVYLHQWERALDLAVKVQTDICCENIVNFFDEEVKKSESSISAQNSRGHSAGVQIEIPSKVIIAKSNPWILTMPQNS